MRFGVACCQHFEGRWYNSLHALLADRTVRCWGYNTYGQVGDGSTTSRSSSVAMSGVSNATMVDANGYFTCVRIGDGAVRCAGINAAGQLGDGSTTTRLTSVAVAEVSGGTACTAATTAPVAETCNMIDDDCNGTVDDVPGMSCP